MRKEFIDELRAAYENEDIKAKVDSAESIDEILKVLNENEVSCTVEDLKEAATLAESGEMTESQLDQVAGGGNALIDFAGAVCGWLGRKVGNMFKKV